MIEIIVWTLVGMVLGFACSITEAGSTLSDELRDWINNR